MPRASRQNPAIREFILDKVTQHPDSVAPLAVKQFGISRTAVSRYLRRLVDEGILTAEGRTNARQYKLATLVKETFTIQLFKGLPEDQIWRLRIAPLIKGAKQNVIDICQYGFTEMLNNAIDHSASPNAFLAYEQNHNEIVMRILDSGVGIFKKIQKDFNLEDPRRALLELSKGKLTSNAKEHSGEGIFFTSRMFDKFALLSGNLSYQKSKTDDGWLMESRDTVEYTEGTWVKMAISTKADWTTKEIFQAFQGEDLRFRKTHVPILLAKYPGEQLVSRSQAKRILSRFQEFSEVMLDFEGVAEISQQFADEIFRVFKEAHPEIELFAINTSPEIQTMIDRIRYG